MRYISVYFGSGRTARTPKLTRGDYGQGFKFEDISLPEVYEVHFCNEGDTEAKTQLGDELLSYLDRGEITSSSFAFTIAKDGEIWSRGADSKLHRRITKIDRLFDVSPVFQPAYTATSSTRQAETWVHQVL